MRLWRRRLARSGGGPMRTPSYVSAAWPPATIVGAAPARIVGAMGPMPMVGGVDRPMPSLYSAAGFANKLSSNCADMRIADRGAGRAAGATRPKAAGASAAATASSLPSIVLNENRVTVCAGSDARGGRRRAHHLKRRARERLWAP